MPLMVKVCAVSDVANGDMRAFSVSGVDTPILVTRHDDNYYAASSMCPHERVSLIGGARRDTRVSCPGHGYEFDLKTGRCSHDPKLQLRVFPVTVRNKEIWISLISFHSR